MKKAAASITNIAVENNYVEVINPNHTDYILLSGKEKIWQEKR